MRGSRGSGGPDPLPYKTQVAVGFLRKMLVRIVERKYFTCPSQVWNPGRWIYRQTLYHVALEAGFYSDVVECLPVDQAIWVRFLAGAGKIFSLYDIRTPSTQYVTPRFYIYT